MKDGLPSDFPNFSPANNTGLSIRQSFPRQNFEITNSPKFYPTRILYYMVRMIFATTIKIRKGWHT